MYVYVYIMVLDHKGFYHILSQLMLRFVRISRIIPTAASTKFFSHSGAKTPWATGCHPDGDPKPWLFV
jgi:hypothetical protein